MFHSLQQLPTSHSTALRSLFICTAFTFCSPFLAPSTLLAADDSPTQSNKQTDHSIPGFERSPIATYQLKVSVKLEASGNRVTKVTATAPIPVDWREQSVKLIEKNVPRGIRVKEQRIASNGSMMMIQVPTIPAGRTATIERIYELTRYRLKLTVDPTTLQKPAKISRKLREFLKSGPGVESTNRKIEKLADTLKNSDASDWDQVHDYFTWVRKNVRYQQGPYKGALDALERKVGDCEDLTALFVTLCHTSDIPARTVWIEGHAYAEFYLEEENGQGYWIPAELAGPPWFGETAADRPILQKGDRIYDPIKRKQIHYIPQTAKAFGGQIKMSSTRTIIPVRKSP